MQSTSQPQKNLRNPIALQHRNSSLIKKTTTFTITKKLAKKLTKNLKTLKTFKDNSNQNYNHDNNHNLKRLDYIVPLQPQSGSLSPLFPTYQTTTLPKIFKIHTVRKRIINYPLSFPRISRFFRITSEFIQHQKPEKP